MKCLALRRFTDLALCSTMLCSIMLCVSVARAQQLETTTDQTPFARLSVAASDLTESQALEKARSILVRVGLVALREPTKVQVTTDIFKRRIWEIRRSEYVIWLDSASGTLLRFKNYQREAEQLRGMGRSGSYAVRDERQAQTTLRQFARIFGVPSNAYLKDIKMYADNDPRLLGAKRTGSVYGEFSLLGPGGVPYHEHHGPGAALVVDPMDGTLVEFNQEWRVSTADGPMAMPAATITRASAVHLGESVYQAHRNRRATSRFMTTNKNERVASTDARLEYVVPNQRIVSDGQLKGEKRGMTFPRVARLAWVVRFGKDEVWIDASDRSQLGTALH